MNELVELCHLSSIGDAGGDRDACNFAGTPGATVLVNGQTPDAGTQTPKFIVPSGKKIRLRLLNESISRHFRLTLLNSGDNKLYRIGGQGGLLDNVILEGGTKGSWVTQYNEGEIVLGSGVRADVLIVPSGNEGAIIQLVGNPLPDPFKLSAGLPANYPIAYFQISGTAADTPPAAGDPILAGTAEEIENIKTGPVITPLIDPVPAPFAPGSSDETIRLTNTIPTNPPPDPFVLMNPGIDDFAAMLDSNVGNGDFLTLPRPPIARYARVGDVLELTVRNDTDAVHPYHLHGFSMQPVRMVDHVNGITLYTFDYDEFLDTIDVYGRQSFVFRVRLDDRAKICDLSPDVPPNEGPVLASCSNAQCGGAEGRWLFHCHILSHGALGMIGELTVVPSEDTQPPQVTCSVATASLSPPDHRLVNVGLSVTATDNCLDPVPVDVQVFSDESEEAPTGDGHFSPDAKDIAPGTLRVRSERNAQGDGRVSLIVTTATDTAGNKAHCCSTVVVPRNQSAAARASVNAQAAAARAFCAANNGAAPAGFVKVGIGPVIGPIQ